MGALGVRTRSGVAVVAPVAERLEGDEQPTTNSTSAIAASGASQ